MLHLNDLIRRFAAFNAAMLLILGLFIQLLAPAVTSAALLQNRSLSLSSSAIGSVAVGAEGTGGNGQKARHTVSFNIATTGNIGSILIQYCTSPVVDVACATPTGFNANNLPNASTTLATTGFSSQNFSVDKTTSNPTGCNGGGTTRTNCVLINRGTAASEAASTAVTIAYGGGASDYITNPTTVNYTFYARITTYSDTGYTTSVDNGSVAASTAQQITITARVPERLEFSVGVGSPVGTLPAPGTSCAPISDAGALTLGDANGVLATNQAYDAYSFFRVNSNTTYGTKIYYSGDTLKNGSNTITAMPTNAGAGTASTPGTRQFGLGLDDTESNYSFTHLVKTTGAYENGDGTINPAGGTARFAFETTSITTPVEVASSTSGITCDTGSVRYVANVSTETPAGIYTTTITYIATGTY